MEALQLVGDIVGGHLPDSIRSHIRLLDKQRKGRIVPAEGEYGVSREAANPGIRVSYSASRIRWKSSTLKTPQGETRRSAK